LGTTANLLEPQPEDLKMFYSKPWLDAIIVLLVVLLFVGPKRLPTLGRSLGQGMREFKDGITGATKVDDDENRPALGAAQATQTAPPAPATSAPERESAEVGSSEQRA
jgi:sec-independent protein translocase protein TatA